MLGCWPITPTDSTSLISGQRPHLGGLCLRSAIADCKRVPCPNHIPPTHSPGIAALRFLRMGQPFWLRGALATVDRDYGILKTRYSTTSLTLMWGPSFGLHNATTLPRDGSKTKAIKPNFGSVLSLRWNSSC
ncbi:hypothetical protein SDJN03_09329, partial [Cucurbita argyrosperma subsp. sororia]